MGVADRALPAAACPAVIPETGALVDMREGEDATISLFIAKELTDK